MVVSRNPFLDYIQNKVPEERRVYGTKVLMAGCESKKIRDSFVRIGVKNILVSYYYLRKAKKDLSELRDDFARFDFVFLDSGGYTLIQQVNEGKVKGDVKEYAMDYYDFLLQTKDMWDVCAEVDVVSQLGRTWMEEQKGLLLENGVRIAPVYQGEPLEEIAEYEWFQKYPYHAMGSAINGAQHRGTQERYLNEAQDFGTLVHGFGMTDQVVLRRGRFYTVDSTSWSAGSRFGTTQIFQNGRIRDYDKSKKDVRKRFKNFFRENNLIWEDIEADKAFEVDMMNALAWKQLSEYVGYNVKNAYWLEDSEKDQAIIEKGKKFKSVVNVGGSVTDMVEAGKMDPTRTGLPSEDDRLEEVLFCDTCNIAGNCPKFQQGMRCQFRFRPQVNSTDGLMNCVQTLLSVQMERVSRGAMFEKIEGGVIDKNLSGEIQMLMKMIADLRAMMDNRDEVTIHAKGSGILSKLFGS